MKKEKYQVNPEAEKYKVKLNELYKQEERNPRFYYEAGLSFNKKLNSCNDVRQHDTIEMAFEKHYTNLLALDMKEHAQALMKGFDKMPFEE